MKSSIIADTGPLVALLNRRDKYHNWARQQFSDVVAPAVTCEAVLSECVFLLRNIESGVDKLLKLLERGVVAVRFSLEPEQAVVARLLRRYQSVPMSLADACLVRMSESMASSTVLTLDSDFRIYRKNGRAVIPLIHPEKI